ncbi:DDE-type integrase/transposase/recombinase, partial [Escherichia coli]|uniref:DDE-type integrase/transposase/recombinase n=1 Tax=Escherichia coli TaxID=562 RepID=UPI0030793146
TVSRKAVAAGDRVNRQFVAERPDQLWVADFTYVSTWQGGVYVAFIIDVFAGYIVGWRVSSSMETTFVLDAKWHLNRSQFGIRIDHDLASISDHSLASQSIT